MKTTSTSICCRTSDTNIREARLAYNPSQSLKAFLNNVSREFSMPAEKGLSGFLHSGYLRGKKVVMAVTAAIGVG